VPWLFDLSPTTVVWQWAYLISI